MPNVSLQPGKGQLSPEYHQGRERDLSSAKVLIQSISSADFQFGGRLFMKSRMARSLAC
jgi:hypothetical protein